jgi:hypothetical protein
MTPSWFSSVTSQPFFILIISIHIDIISCCLLNSFLAKLIHTCIVSPQATCQAIVPSLDLTTLAAVICRSQWPRCPRHEMSSPTWILGSWVRIPLEAWMFVCVYSVSVLSCVGSGLATGLHPSKESYQPSISVRLRNLIKRRPRPDMGCSAI